MAKLALEDIESADVIISNCEVARSGPSYALETIFQLQKEKNENQRMEIQRKAQKDKTEQVLALAKILADNDQETARLAVEMFKAKQDIDQRQASKVADAGIKLVDIIGKAATTPQKGNPQQ